MQIVVLAAGKGSRMKSRLPKVLHKLCGLTLLERSLRAACKLKPRAITVVLGQEAELVREQLRAFQQSSFAEGIEFFDVLQSPQQGTGQAVQVAVPSFLASVEQILVMPADCPLIKASCLENLLAQHERAKPAISLLSCTPPEPQGFGRIKRDVQLNVLAIVEEKDCSAEEKKLSEINSSIYAFSKSFLAEEIFKLENKNAQSEYYLTDLVERAVGRAERVLAFCDADYQALLGANTRAELAALEKIQRLRINTEAALNGVSFEDLESTYIEEDVVLAEDCYLGAGSRLYGKTRLAEGVSIEGDSVLRNAEVGKDSRIKLGCYIEDSSIGPACEVGPFAHIRPGSRFEAHVKVGSFVETKKAHLKSGAKANHLAYLGDASIGEGANIGAGTIFCNYDGVNKHHTEIGASAFVGSNSCLVAPVRVGEGSYIAAGSTITKDVPAKSLAVGRARQIVKEGWKKK